MYQLVVVLIVQYLMRGLRNVLNFMNVVSTSYFSNIINPNSSNDRHIYIKFVLLFIIYLDTCSLAANSGSCHGRYPRWFYNSTSSHCELFPYGGCDGNSNRFTTLEQCIDTCGEYDI